MTRTEFLDLLSKELKKTNAEDVDEIIEEYKEHFDFKLQEGYSEEEIAARLGNPAELAVQFKGETSEEEKSAGFLTLFGLYAADFFMFFGFILMIGFAIVIAAGAIAFAALGVCLITTCNPAGLIPAIPYISALILGVSSISLALLIVCGFVWYIAFLKQCVRAFGCFNKNMRRHGRISAYPSIPLQPQIKTGKRRLLRHFVTIFLIIFAILFVAGIIVSAISAGTPAFWHAWGWFK